MSWQIVPRVLIDLMDDTDPAVKKRAFDSMMNMRKIDIAEIERACRG